MSSSLANSTMGLVLIQPDKNTTFDSLNKLLDSIGFNHSIKLAYLTVYMVFALIGLLTNILTCVVITRGHVRTNLFFYFKLITWINIGLSVLHLVYSVIIGRHYYSLSNSILTQYFFCYLYTPALGILGFYKYVLNALIAADRILSLRPDLRVYFGQCSARFYSIVTLVISIIVVAPGLLIYVPEKYFLYFIESGQVTELYVSTTSRLARQADIMIALNILAVLRTILLCALDTSLNVISICLFRKFLSRRSGMIKFSITGVHSSSSSTNLKDLRHSPSQTSSSITIRSPYAYAAELNLNKFVMIHCSLSTIQQLLLLITFVAVTVTEMLSASSAALIFFTGFYNVIRNATYFFLFYFFNKKFKRDCNKLFKNFLYN